MITDALLPQDFVGAGGDRPVRRLDDQRRPDAVGVAEIDHRLHRRRDQDVALRLEHATRRPRRTCRWESPSPRRSRRCALRRNSIGSPLSVRIAPSRSMTPTIRAPSSSDRNFAAWKPTLPRPCTMTRLPSSPPSRPRPLHVLGMAEELAQRVLHPAPGRLDAPGDAAGVQRLAGDAGGGVDVGGVHPPVLVGDPGHLALAGAHVGRGHVLARIDQVALGELVGEAPGDQLQLVLVPLARIDPEPALRAAERHLDQRALVGHQRRQRLDLVLVHAHRDSGCRP